MAGAKECPAENAKAKTVLPQSTGGFAQTQRTQRKCRERKESMRVNVNHVIIVAQKFSHDGSSIQTLGNNGDLGVGAELVDGYRWRSK